MHERTIQVGDVVYIPNKDVTASVAAVLDANTVVTAKNVCGRVRYRIKPLNEVKIIGRVENGQLVLA